MKIKNALTELRKEAKLVPLDLENEYGLIEDEDLIVFALNFLKANIDSAFDGLEEEIKEHDDTNGCCECGSKDHICQDCPTFQT